MQDKFHVSDSHTVEFSNSVSDNLLACDFSTFMPLGKYSFVYSSFFTWQLSSIGN